MKNLIKVKRLLSFVTALVFSFLRPVKDERFLFISMNGKCFGGNPKAVYDYLKKSNARCETIWAFSADVYDCYKDACVATRLYSFKYYLCLLSSRVIFCDQRTWKPIIPLKRKGQIYVQTWHGTALKKIERDMPNLPKAYETMAMRDSALVDLWVSGSAFMSSLYKNSFWYNNEILEVGSPRNDVFWASNKSEIRKKVCSFLNIKDNEKMVLYAPTFRGHNSFSYYDVNIKAVVEILSDLDGEKWNFITRFHPNLISELNEGTSHLNFMTMDASLYPDIQELLVAADVLITDYSSVMFDFMYSRKPCFIYAIDVEEYDRGFYMSLTKDLPFDVAEDNNQLAYNIKSFNQKDYEKKLDVFFELIGSKENGNACQRLLDHIWQKMG